MIWGFKFRSPPLILLPTIAAIAALYAGVALATIEAKSPRLMAVVQGLSQGVVATLVLGHVLPEAVEEIGGAAIALAALGGLSPLLVNDRLSRIGGVTMVIVGLTLHAILDGAVIGVAPSTTSGGAITIAVIAHRLPLALVLAAWLRKAWGARGPWLGATALSLATVVGVWVGGGLSEAPFSWSWLTAPVGGMLLHVLFHSRRCVAAPLLQSVGLIFGLVLGLFVPHA